MGYRAFLLRFARERGCEGAFFNGGRGVWAGLLGGVVDPDLGAGGVEPDLGAGFGGSLVVALGVGFSTAGFSSSLFSPAGNDRSIGFELLRLGSVTPARNIRS